MRPSFLALLLAVLCAAIAALAVLSLRWPFEPNAQEVLDQDFAAAARWTRGPIAAVIAALSVAVWLRLSERGVRAGSFGAFVAVVLACGLTLLPLPLRLSQEAVFASAGLAAAIAVALAPWFRERGILTLALGGAIVALPPIVALRAAHERAFLATTLAQVTRTVGASKVPLLGIVLERDVSDLDAEAMALRVSKPWADADVSLLVARKDEPAAPMLRRLDLPLLSVQSGRCLPLAALDGPLARATDVEVSIVRDANGALSSLAVRFPRSGPGAQVIVITPCGSIDGTFDDQQRAVFAAEDLARLRAWLRPLPPGTALRVVVVPPDAVDTASWTELRT
ncbi:MAG: hypothetical protein ABL997_07720 [Planctomycetota bacterium]